MTLQSQISTSQILPSFPLLSALKPQLGLSTVKTLLPLESITESVKVIFHLPTVMSKIFALISDHFGNIWGDSTKGNVNIVLRSGIFKLDYPKFQLFSFLSILKYLYFSVSLEKKTTYVYPYQ